MMSTQYDSQRTCTWCACSFIEITDAGEFCYSCKRPSPTREESKAFFSERPRTRGLIHEQNSENFKARA